MDPDNCLIQEGEPPDFAGNPYLLIKLSSVCLIGLPLKLRHSIFHGMIRKVRFLAINLPKQEIIHGK
jgi:hypothetical protein